MSMLERRLQIRIDEPRHRRITAIAGERREAGRRLLDAPEMPVPSPTELRDELGELRALISILGLRENDMSGDFHKLIEDIESEANAEGPAAEAELRDVRRELSIANQLLTLRREQKLTQNQLAEKSGIPQSEISRIETGQGNPTYATLSALAEPFGSRIGFIHTGAA